MKLYTLLLLPVLAFAEPQGYLNEAVTQYTIDTTICVPNWTTTIRPSSSYTNKLKLKQIKEAGLSGSVTKYEEDHFLPLALGGHPTDERNLWPEAWDGDWGAHKKDRLENHLHRAVCNKHVEQRMMLKDAQTCILTDWKACYKKEIGDED